ncbi:MAG: 2-deoxy-5-keto-D-gluconate 6-phosphate aldolase domain-containing protein [Acidimicrobiia bacterium]
MTLGYDGRLYILAFDHRGSFKKKMFGIADREPTPDEQDRINGAKRLIWDGFQRALDAGAPRDAAGILVDEEMGASVAREAKEMGLILAMPVEKSGQDIFDFEYGDDFGTHVEEFDPAFTKVLVRWNPADPDEQKADQGTRLRRLSEWLHDKGRKFLFELLVPATESQLEQVAGDPVRYDEEVRPGLMLATIRELHRAGIEPDVWKIEGIDRREDCVRVAELIRSGRRDGVVAVVLGRGANESKVDHWLETGAPVDGYRGFAIGRSIWWDAVAGFRDRAKTEERAASEIATNFRRFISVYESATP